MNTEPGRSVTADPVRIDPDTIGDPISPFIFGQFIEHLGRCIYGGIWAEMLEDRKFLDPVDAGDSPWRTFGGASARMESDAPFVGDHTPAIQLPGHTDAGLGQAGLTVEAGRDYVGHIWLAGEPSAGPVHVRLVWGGGEDGRWSVMVCPIGSEYVKAPLHFLAAASSTNARLEIASRGSGILRVGAVSLMPADNVDGVRADVLELLRRLDAPIYRWPGGNFVSGYDWRDGIGDRDRRPPRKNPAWRGIEHNDFGIHEFMRLVELLETEPLIVVNTGFGDASSAALEVEYVNGTPNTPMGQWRAANGRLEPWNVIWWGVGNEMFGDWQLGHMSIGQYVVKHNDVERKMRAADPRIRTIAVGEHGDWSRSMMERCADHMDLISEHFYVFKPTEDPAEHAALMTAMIREKADAHRRYREELPNLAGKDIRIAMDEWNYWYGDDIVGELGVRYSWKDAMGVAAGLHEYFRQTDMIFMANYAQTVNVLGCIKTTPDAAAFESAGLVLALYRRHFGSLPLNVSGAPEPVDVAAALTEDRSALTVGVVNPSGAPVALTLDVCGLQRARTATLFRMRHDNPDALNNPGEAPAVDIEESRVEFADRLIAPPYSVSLFVAALEG